MNSKIVMLSENGRQFRVHTQNSRKCNSSLVIESSKVVAWGRGGGSGRKKLSRAQGNFEADGRVQDFEYGDGIGDLN